MSHKFGKLIELIGALELALEKVEWEEIAKLDQSVRVIVSDCASLAVEERDKTDLNGLLAKLQKLYDRITAENIERRSELGVELKKLHKERNAISQYIQSSGY